MQKKPTFYEFFAGAGMVRAGLGKNWSCLLANDFDRKKGITYSDNWGNEALIVDDIRNLSYDEMPGNPDMAWGSFPCQDLSLAGGGAGLRGDRSGTFWPFIEHMRELKRVGRAPKIITLENVLGALTSHKGKDFTAIIEALTGLGYYAGAVVVDAALFLPQSRPRVFVVAMREDLIQPELTKGGPVSPWHPKSLQNAYARLSNETAQKWLWWNMPKPRKRKKDFIDVIEDDPSSVRWHTQTETLALLSMMSDVNLAKVATAKEAGVAMVGGIYKRTRYEQGIKVQRAEIRFDKLAGCLRTPAGGSSRQLILTVDGSRIRSRLISTRETARLMGLPETYKLPERYNEAYHLTGDGVAVPAVRYLAKHIFEPVLQFNAKSTISAQRPMAEAK